MRNFTVVECLDYDHFKNLNFYESFTIFYWKTEKSPVTDNPGVWDSFTTDIIGAAITLDSNDPIMLLNTDVIKEIVTRQGYGSGGGGGESKVITLSGRPRPGSSGEVYAWRIPMFVPSGYQDRVMDGNSWIMKVGEIMTVKGIVNIAGKGTSGQDLFMSWDVNVTVAMNSNKEIITLVNEIVPHSVPVTEGQLWYMELQPQSYWQPDDEEIENGATPIEANFCFTLTTQDYESYGSISEITGELMFTKSTHNLPQ